MPAGNDNIDNLNIQISADAERAQKSLDKLCKTLINVKKELLSFDTSGFTGAANEITRLSKGFADATKPLENLKKSAKGLSNIRAKMDISAIEDGIEDLRGKFRDAGNGFEFKGNTTELAKEIKNTTAQLDRLFDKEDKLKAIGANINTQGFRGLEFDISRLTNKLDILNAKSRTLKELYNQNLANLSIQRGDPQPLLPDSGNRIADISPDAIGYNKSAMTAVFGDEFRDITNFAQAVNQLGDNAGKVINGIAIDTGKLKKVLDSSGLSAAQFAQYLENIRIPAIQDTELKKLQSELDKTERKLNELEAKSDNWAAKGINPDSSKFRNLQEQIVYSSKYADALKLKIQQINASSPPLSGWKKLQNIFTAMSQNVGKIKISTQGTLGTVTKLKNGFLSLAKSIKNLIPGFNKINRATNNIRKSAGDGFGLGKMFQMSVLYSGIFAVISGIQNAVQEGSQNLAQYSAAFNSSLSSMMSALTKLKNAFAVAFAPIINTVAPYITAFINMISAAMNKVGQFFAALTGKSFTPQAVTVVQDYAAGLQETSESMDDTTGSAKKLKKALSVLSFDQLNQLNATDESGSETSPGGSAGNGAANELLPSDMFTTVPIAQEIQDFADKVKKVFANLFKPFAEAWSREGENTIEAASYAFDNLKELARSVGASFMSVWTNGTGTQTLTTLLQIAQNLLGIVGGLAGQFALAWNTAGIGTAIIQNIFNLFNIVLGTIRDITGQTMLWAQQLDFTPLLQSINTLLVALQPLTENIGAGLEWFWTNVLLPIGSWTLQEAVPTFLNMLASGISVVNSVLEALQPLGTWLWDSFLQPLGRWTGDIIIGAMETVAGLLDRFSGWVAENQELVQGIATVIGSFATAWGLVSGAVTIWNGIATIASGVTTALGTAIGFLTSPIGIAVAAIGGIIAAGVLLYQNWDTVKEKAAQLGEWISGKWEFVKTKTVEIWENVSTFISETWTNIIGWAVEKFESIKTTISDAWDAVKTKTVEIWDGIIETLTGLPEKLLELGKSAINGFLNGIVEVVSNIKGWIEENIFNPIVGGFKELFGINSPSTVFSELGSYLMEGLIGGISGLVGDVTGIFDTIGSKIGETWENVKTATSEAWEGIKSTAEGIWEKLKAGAAKLFGETEDTVSESTEQMKTDAETNLSGVGEAAESAFGDVSDTTVLNWGNSAEEVKLNLRAMKLAASEQLAAMTETVRSYSQSMYNIFTKKFESLGERISQIIENMDTGLNTSFQKLFNSLSSSIDSSISRITRQFSTLTQRISNSMQGMYNIGRNAAVQFANGISSVHIPMPHINVNSNTWYNGSGYSYSMSSSVNWYKMGGLFATPAVIGVGEAGKEAVLPLENRRTMSMIADSIMENTPAFDDGMLTNAVSAGMSMAMMNNQGNQTPINLYATLYTEDNEVLARAVAKGQDAIDYRTNPTPRFGY